MLNDAPTRDARPTIAEAIRRACRRFLPAGASAGASRIQLRDGVLEHLAEPLENARGGAASPLATPPSASSQRLFQASRLASIFSAPWRRQPRDDHAAVRLRANALDVAGVGEMVEHLRDRARVSGAAAAASSPAASSPRSSQLEQQLELRVAQLGAARCVSRPRSG